MNRHAKTLVGVFILCSCVPGFGLRASALESYHLDLSGHEPRTGEEGERTLRLVTSYEDSVSNSVHLLELKGRERVLMWDVSNDMSKVEMVVDQFIEEDGTRRNELLKPGSTIVGKCLLGESFFRLRDGHLPFAVQKRFAQIYNIRPRKFNPFAKTRLPPSVSIGETWKLPTPMDLDAIGVLGKSFTNGIEATGQFVGTTNEAGLECFHLRQRVVSTNTPAFIGRMLNTAGLPGKMDVQAGITTDLIVPFDVSQRILAQRYLMEISAATEMGGAKSTNTSRSKQTTTILDEFRPLSPSASTAASQVAAPGELDAAQIEDIWSNVWASGDSTIQAPELEPLSAADVVQQMAGKWTVMFGVTPDPVTIALRTDQSAEVSGEKDGKAWKKTGRWQVNLNKLVLFLKEDSLPSFIFKTHGQYYIFDPWAKTMMSELNRER